MTKPARELVSRYPSRSMGAVMNCVFEPIKPGVYKCRTCGRLVRSKSSAEQIFAQCRNPLTEEQRNALLEKGTERLGVSFGDVAHYTKALLQWGIKGFPTRTDEDVKAFHAICMECNHQVEGRCRLCGCRVTTSSLPIINKIKMGSEKCPLGKWG